MISSTDILQASILIVDDQDANVSLLEQMLRGAGYVSITSTTNPREVCALYRKNRYSLILLDLQMAGMDGFQVMEDLKAIEADGYLPVLVQTAQPAHKLRALKTGAKDFISKPFDLAEVLVRVHNMLEVRLLHLESKTRTEQAEKSENAVRASELSYRRLFEAARDGILILDVDTGRIKDVNPFLVELLGFSHNEMVGKTVGELSPFKDIESNHTMLERLQKDGYARYEDLPLQTRDNHQIAVEFVGNVYPAGDRKVIQCIIRDISERKRLSLELERSQRQQLLLKDEILSQVSHELRLPLAATYQFITILLDGLVGTLDDGQRQYLKLALKNINQLRTMIDDLLEVARAVSGKLTIEPRCVALGELVVETLATLQGAASAKGIALKLNVPDELPLAWVDRRRVQQILWALLDNAIKFTPDNGSIAVRIEANENDADFLTFGIADTGCGIPRDDRERVFDRLFQVDNILEVSRKGLGLGLYICKDLVTRHGGRIWIESPQRTLPAQTACGSEIFFTLPRLPWTKLLAPVVGQNGPHSGRFNVITAKVLRQDNEPCVQELGEAARTLAWKTLSRCLHSDREVLLPRFATQENEQFLVIAGADQSGAEDLITRIHEQVQSDKGLHHAGLDLSSSFIVLDTPILENTGVLVHELGRRFESLMKEKTTEKS